MSEHKSLQIQTHCGTFHADEVIAVTMLSNHFNSLNFNVKIVRSREIKPQSDILVDVGGEYNPEKHRFDHHQTSCSETWNRKSKIPLSSVGMIWKHYGVKILSLQFKNKDLTYKDFEILVNRIYHHLIIEIDAHDNGIILKGKSNTSNFNITSIISSCNRRCVTDEMQDINFKKAMIVTSQILDIKINDIVESYINHKIDIYNVKKLLKTSNNYIIIRDNIPTINKCLTELDKKYNIAFIVFVSEKEITIKARKQIKYKPLINILPYNRLINNLTNPKDLIFVHKKLFIAKCTTLKTGLEIIKYSSI